MCGQMLSTKGVVLNECLQMKQQCTVATSHVTQTQGLLVERTIEHFLDNLVKMTKIGLVRTA